MKLIVWISSVITCITSVNCMGLFRRDANMYAQRPVDGFIERAVHVTKVGCASLCEGSNICMSFFFTPGDGQCQLHSTVFDPALYTGSTEPATDVLYYEREHVEVPFNCDKIGSGEWTEARPFIGPNFNVMLLGGPELPFTNASAACASAGGRLPRLDTIHKLEFYQTHVMTCPSVKGLRTSFWSDVVGDATPGVWRTSSGVVIPMAQGPGTYWAAGKPQFWAAQHCTEMDFKYGFKLDDEYCGTVESVICERD